MEQEINNFIYDLLFIINVKKINYILQFKILKIIKKYIKIFKINLTKEWLKFISTNNEYGLCIYCKKKNIPDKNRFCNKCKIKLKCNYKNCANLKQKGNKCYCQIHLYTSIN